MAYIAFQELGGATVARQALWAAPSHDPVPTGTERLSALEWSVVAIARKDRRASLRRPGRLAVAMRAVFKQPNPRLADERLEALRRIAVLTWRDAERVPTREVRAFLAAGFTPEQHRALVRSIDRAARTAPAMAASA